MTEPESDSAKFLLDYIRDLEEDHKKMRAYIEEDGALKPCKSFDPECYNCQGYQIISNLKCKL